MGFVKHKEDDWRALELKPKCTGEFAHMLRAKSIILAMDNFSSQKL